LRLRYTQDEIAAMVGSVREVVQRALKTLEHAGLIEMARGQIRIIDVAALGAWTGERVTVHYRRKVELTGEASSTKIKR
jgi:DNA-binding transcriptional regulator YhcF (GntR family)